MKPKIHRQIHEKTDPTKLVSRVAFKRPLSAHERVLRALKTHDILKKLEAEPGDESFDDPPYEELTPHQLIQDPDTGEEMTAGEHVMLQHERAQARYDVQKATERALHLKAKQKARKQAPGKGGKAAKGEIPLEQNEETEEVDE